MQWRNTDDRYGALSIALHWMMFFLLVAVVAFMELREIFPKGSAPREMMKSWHYALGVLILPLTVLRLVAGLPGLPAGANGAPRWQRALAASVKAGLYALMLGMPLAGWLLLSAEGGALVVLNWELPPLVRPDETLANYMESVHETGATVAYLLLGLHILGALYHHFVLRDKTLRRMLPWS